MEYLKFSLLTESDFDAIVVNAGGKRYTDDPKIKELNCDYILDDAVIELKIIEEEPIEKKTKQKKLAELFPSNAKTVVLYPTDNISRKYYRILATSIKDRLSHASKQLKESAKNINAKVKIAIIMNNGLTMTSPDEFLKVAIERTKNDTSGIDILIVCGVYYFSDKFDMRVITNFENIQIQGDKRDSIIEKLRDSWNNKVEQYITSQMHNIDKQRTKEPIQDLFFELDGTRYVKPVMQWGDSSSFYINGRPREDSTNEDELLPLTMVIPTFDYQSYSYVKTNLIQSEILQNSLDDYMQWIKNKQKSFENSLQIIVPIMMTIKELEDLKIPFSINEIQNNVNLKYENLYNEIKDKSIEYSNDIFYKNFILLEVQEIGIDKANDIAYISNIIFDNNSKTFKQNWLVYGERIKYEYAMSLASSYCLLLDAKIVCYHRNEDFKWK